MLDLAEGYLAVGELEPEHQSHIPAIYRYAIQLTTKIAFLLLLGYILAHRLATYCMIMCMSDYYQGNINKLIQYLFWPASELPSQFHVTHNTIMDNY